MSMAALSAKRFLFRPVSTCALHKKSPGSAERPTSSLNTIRNSRLTTEWSDVQRATLPIAGKAVSIMINYVGLGDLYRIYLEVQRAGAGFNVAYIGDDFQAEHKEQFDQGYMRALYRFAYEKAARGYPWEHAPPGFQAEDR